MTPHLAPSRRHRACAVAVAVSVVLAGCSSDDDASSDGSSSAETTATAPVDLTVDPSSADGSASATESDSSAPSAVSTVPVATTTPDAVIDVSTPPGAPDAVGALDDVTGLECVAADGNWTASGTVTNPTSATVDYRIYVSFLDTAGETLALIESNVSQVAAGAAAPWSALFASTATDLECVLRVERLTM